jgi:ubiquinone/menaquinone biosynthesis C-methylase UbiE
MEKRLHMPDNTTDPQFIKDEQYRNSSNLGARIRLHEFYSTNTHDMFHHLFDLLLATCGSDGRVLEIGCGRGDLWKKNIDRVPDAWDVTLTDLSDGMLDDAQAMLGDGAARFNWQTADIQELPFEDNRFDMVVANFMLYHVPDIQKGLREVARVLKPGGVLHSATNGSRHMRELEMLTEDVIPGYTYTPWHSSFSLDNGTAQLEQVFDDVILVRRDDAISTSDAQPIVDYLLSGNRIDTTDDSVIAEMTRLIQQRIDENGHFHVTKSAGIFVSRHRAG